MHAQTPKAFSTRMLTCLADTSKQSVSDLKISLTYAHKAGQTTVDRSRDLSNELAVLKSSFIPTMMSHRFVACICLLSLRERGEPLESAPLGWVSRSFLCVSAVGIKAVC